MPRNNSKQSGESMYNNISVERKEGLQWERFVEKEGFKPGKKE